MKNQFMKVVEEVLVVKVCQAFSCKNYNIKSETGQLASASHPILFKSHTVVDVN